MNKAEGGGTSDSSIALHQYLEEQGFVDRFKDEGVRAMVLGIASEAFLAGYYNALLHAIAVVKSDKLESLQEANVYDQLPRTGSDS